MADIPESVYLNAAMAFVLSSPDLAGSERLPVDDPRIRAAVESVWEARGEHDTAAIQRVRELHRPVPYSQPMMTIDRIEHTEYCAQCGFGVPYAKCPTIAALDSPPPSPEEFQAHIERIEARLRAAGIEPPAPPSPEGEGARLRSFAEWLVSQDDADRPWKRHMVTVAEVINRARAALDGGQPDTPAPIKDHPVCDCGHAFEMIPLMFHLGQCAYRRSYDRPDTPAPTEPS